MEAKIPNLFSDQKNFYFDGYIYIATTSKYKSNNIFKIDKTTNLLQTLVNFDQTKDAQDKFYVCYCEQVYNMNGIQSFIDNVFKEYRYNNQHNIYIIKYELLLEYIKKIIPELNESFLKICNIKPAPRSQQNDFKFQLPIILPPIDI